MHCIVPESKADYKSNIKTRHKVGFLLVGQLGFEPRTRGLKGPCSNQLSYRPKSVAEPSYYTVFSLKPSMMTAVFVFQHSQNQRH